jgi:xanthine dehydrogenase large subunit
MGGGFGGKESQGNALAVGCAVAAALTGQPCKMRYDRDDDMMITGKRHDFRIDYDVGFDADGRVTGVDFTQMTRCGWALDLSIPVADRAMLHADNAYHLPSARITSHRLKTNTQSATAYRGFGGPQGVLGIERVIDHVANELRLDPVLVRQRNYYAEMANVPNDDPDPKKGKGARFGSTYSPKVNAQTTPYGMEVNDFILGEMTDALMASSDYETRRSEIAQFNANNPILKRGIAFAPVKFGIFH